MIFLTDAELDTLYEASKIDQIPVGSEIRQLIGEIRYHRRLDRVDTALARRLSEHMQRDAALLTYLRNWLDCYKTDIFPEPDLAKTAEVLKANGMTIDSLSANMGRHVLSKVIEQINQNDDDERGTSSPMAARQTAADTPE